MATERPNRPLSQDPWFQLLLVVAVLVLVAVGGAVADAGWAWWAAP